MCESDLATTLSPKATTFLQSRLCHFIAGEWRESRDGRDGDLFNPSDGSRLASIAIGGAADIDEAVHAAHHAFKTWGATAAVDRAVLLHRLADAMERDAATLAEIEALDVGKALAAAESFDVPFATDCVRYFADMAASSRYDVPLAIRNIDARSHLTPYGPCGFILPWNFPLDLLMWGIIPALAAGNTVVVKPSEVTPMSTLYICRLAQEVGFRDGVINVVLGNGPDAGAPLAAHPRIRRMAFTGSSEVGRRIGAVCGGRPIPCKLELGGKGAAVVFADTEIPATAQALADAITLNTGQVCCTATRWIVDEAILSEFSSSVSAALERVVVGPALSRKTTMGPLVSEIQRRRVRGYVSDGLREGATNLSVVGDEPDDLNGGYYVKPQVLLGGEQNICFREEIFGPVAYLTSFRTEEEAVQLVNALPYGLANSVWTTNLVRANRVAENMIGGNSWINAHNVFAYGLPYGGVNLSGVGGGVNSPATFLDYLQSQTIARPLG